MNQALLLFGLSSLFACLLLAVGILFAYSSQRNQAWINRLQTGTSKGTGSASAIGSSTQGFTKFLGLLEVLGQATQPQKATELSEIQLRLRIAGYRAPNAPIIFWGTRILVGFLGITLFASISYPASLASFLIFPKLFFIVLGALLGLYLPNIWLQFKIKGRQQQIREGFPDILDLLVVCVEAGLGLDAAIARVSHEIKSTYPVICREFEDLALELRVGLTREEALRNLNARIGLEEVQQLTALLIQSDELGSSIAQALRVHAESMRKKRQARAEEIAAKLPVKLTLPLIFFIFPSLFIVLLGPAGIQAYEVLLPALGGGK